MAIDNILGIAGTAMAAQIVRLNATASNMANASTVASTEQEAYRAKRTVFRALVDERLTHAGAQFVGGVKVEKLVDDQTPVRRVFEPNNPLADSSGFVYHSNVNEIGEMVEIMAASRSYQNNVEVSNTARQLLMRTIELTRT